MFMEQRNVTLTIITDQYDSERLEKVFKYYREVGLKISQEGKDLFILGTLIKIVHLVNSLGLNRISVTVKAVEDANCQLMPVPFREASAHSARYNNFSNPTKQ